MSTDWIKMRVDLRTHPKVVRMASALRADKLRVIGGLFAVWAIFDAHSSDGVLDGYTFQAIDAELGWKGFAQAMSDIEWLMSTDGMGLTAPRFEEHNGQSAKRRAMETERKRLEREAERLATKPGHASASHADKNVTREEKRREEKENPPESPKGEGRFPEFWAAWPTSTRKQDRKKCLAKWQRNHWDAKAAEIVAHVKAMCQTKQWLEGFEPAPLTYLNGERWDDGIPGAGGGQTDDIFAGAR